MSGSGPLRVAIDATSLLGARTGVGHVTAGMVRTLAARDDVELTAFAVTWRGRHELAGAVPAGVRSVAPRTPARFVRAGWARLGRPRAEHWTGPVDVVHAPNFVAPPADAPVVVTVHDLTFLRFPELCTPDTLGYPAHLRRAFAAGALVHAVSDTIAAEVRDAFGLDADRVRRVYAGVDVDVPSDAEPGDAARMTRPRGSQRYVLAMGTIEPRKNLPNLVRAFDAVAASHPDLDLVLAGPDGWDSGALEQARKAAHHADRIHRLGYVDETDRRPLLEGATLLAYPSLYEGFGHPPLEAMAVGVPVVAARAGALPEVLGDAALLPDPHDVDEIAGALDRALSDDELRRTLVARGHERVRRYTWAEAGDGLVALYRSATGSDAPSPGTSAGRGPKR